MKLPLNFLCPNSFLFWFSSRTLLLYPVFSSAIRGIDKLFFFYLKSSSVYVRLPNLLASLEEWLASLMLVYYQAVWALSHLMKGINMCMCLSRVRNHVEMVGIGNFHYYNGTAFEATNSWLQKQWVVRGVRVLLLADAFP